MRLLPKYWIGIRFNFGGCMAYICLTNMTLFRIIKSRSRAFLPLLGILATVFSISACEKIYDEPKDNVDIAANFALDLHTPTSLFEMVNHVSFELLDQGLFQSNADAIGQKLGAKIALRDSIFSDDDSIIYEIQFDPRIPNSFDLKKRQGTILVIVHFNYTEVGGRIQTRISPQNPYILKINESTQSKLTGTFYMERLDQEVQRFSLDSLQLFTSESPDIPILGVGYLDFKSISGQQTPGLSGDMVEIQGEGIWSRDQDISNWNIILPLRMRYEYGCSQYVHRGMIRLLTQIDRYIIDFDPFETGACNKIIKITKGGNQFEVVLP